MFLTAHIAFCVWWFCSCKSCSRFHANFPLSGSKVRCSVQIHRSHLSHKVPYSTFLYPVPDCAKLIRSYQFWIFPQWTEFLCCLRRNAAPFERLPCWKLHQVEYFHNNMCNSCSSCHKKQHDHFHSTSRIESLPYTCKAQCLSTLQLGYFSPTELLQGIHREPLPWGTPPTNSPSYSFFIETPPSM